jgi:hypothetical protein
VVLFGLQCKKHSFHARKGQKMSCQNCVFRLTTCHWRGWPAGLFTQ